MTEQNSTNNIITTTKTPKKQTNGRSNNRMVFQSNTIKRPPFPEMGSTIGNENQYFCLGRLGRGTFCSIHKCIDLSYAHNMRKNHADTNNNKNYQNDNNNYKNDSSKIQQQGSNKTHHHHNEKKLRVVAAKVELSTYTNSGVIDGEATVLKHLSMNMPPDMIPVYVDYVKTTTTNTVNGNPSSAANLTSTNTTGDSVGRTGDLRDQNFQSPSQSTQQQQQQQQSGISAIIMEYLMGEDMHQLRDRHCQIVAANYISSTKTNTTTQSVSSSRSSSSQQFRRLCIEDAVYLCAEVILPLLQNMHNCGVIHRDVKPSNCVRSGTSNSNKKFKLVDFGLSKSFIVPISSSLADERYIWKKAWNSAFASNLPSSSSQCNFNHNNSSNDSDGKNDNLSSQERIVGCIRKERDQADFRGTSMYASLRVHQSRDYCRRDDLWGLMYVFCDLVTGGLPWMGHAAKRNRDRCRCIKEWVHGERERYADDLEVDPADYDNPLDAKINRGDSKDRIAELLKGSEYHTVKHERECILRSYLTSATTNTEKTSLDEQQPKLPPLPTPLSLSNDLFKIKLLQKAFDHLAVLDFASEPDYDLIKQCILDFKKFQPPDVEKENSRTPPLDWCQQQSQNLQLISKSSSKRNQSKVSNAIDIPKKVYQPKIFFEDTDDEDPLPADILDEAEREKQSLSTQQKNTIEISTIGGTGNGVTSGTGVGNEGISAEIDDLVRLPLSLQFQIAQAEYNALHPDTIPRHLALRDWMAFASSLVYDTWDSAKFERGTHRRDDDGYRRELYMKLLQLCLDTAKPFDYFTDNPKECRECFSHMDENVVDRNQNQKRRKLNVKYVGCADDEILSPNYYGDKSCLLAFSRVFSALQASLEEEKSRSFAPPPAISFGNYSG